MLWHAIEGRRKERKSVGEVGYTPKYLDLFVICISNPNQASLVTYLGVLFVRLYFSSETRVLDFSSFMERPYLKTRSVTWLYSSLVQSTIDRLSAKRIILLVRLVSNCNITCKNRLTSNPMVDLFLCLRWFDLALPLIWETFQ